MTKILIIITLFLSLNAHSQNVTISGYIKDITTGEALIGVTIYNTNQKTGTSSNNYGFYSLTVKQADTIGLLFSYIGYTAQAKKITSTTDIVLNITLKDNSQQISEVEVNASRNDNNVNKPQMSVIDVPMKQILTLPAVAGERDILKIIQLLPGVQSGQEGTTGYHVRGGNTDQNLVQLDEATLYNPNHLFGIFSTFNVNALNNVTLIKGGFPAQYGGRLSSILDISMKEGNKEKFSVSGGLGLVSSNLTVEGPFKKGKSSFIVSLRRSYIDLYLKLLAPSTNYYFYDINAKINYTVSDKDKLYLSFFSGLDNAKYTDATSLNYRINFGNLATTLRWNHLFSNKLFANTSFVFDDYHNSVSTLQGKYFAQLYTGIRDVNIKSDLQYYPNPIHSIRGGVNYSFNTYFPASVSAKVPKSGITGNLQPDSIPRKYSQQLAFYASDDITITSKLAVSLGLRIPLFITSSVHYIKPEPRITVKESILPNLSIKASYSEMNQFLHQVPSSTASLPTDIWISSSKIVAPELSRQVALGLYANFKENMFEASIEGYYKTMQNQVLLKEGTQPLLTSDIDQQLTFGNGRSYGVEFFFRKSYGKLTGWVSYTLSWSNQQFDSLNFGNRFPATYDKRHNIAVVATYDINKRWTVSADWVFTSGGAFTLPTGRVPVYQDGSLYDGSYQDYTTRNNYRYRSYNRLDVSVIYHLKTHKLFSFPFESDIAFSIYNAYYRRNPYFIYLTTDPVTKQPQAKEVSLLPIVPGVSWNFKF